MNAWLCPKCRALIAHIDHARRVLTKLAALTKED